MSTILRYKPRNGDTEERLQILVRTKLQSVSQSQLSRQVLMGFKRGSKLLAQTHNCATVVAGEHVGLQAKLRDQYTKMTNKMQLCRIIYYYLAAVHVSSDIFAHHQEHINCITASGITHVCRCRLVSWECCFNNITYGLELQLWAR